MTRSKLLGRPLLAFGSLCVVSALAAALLLLPAIAPAAEAANEGAKTEMHLEIAGVDVLAEPLACDSRVDTTCKLATGSAFSLSVVPNTIPIGGYSGWQTEVDYGSLLYKPTLRPGDEISWDRNIGLEGRSPSQPTGKEGSVAHGDVSAIFSPLPVSFQKTALATFLINCATNAQSSGSLSETVSIVAFDGLSGSIFVQNSSTVFEPNVSSLTVQCNPAIITPTPTPVSEIKTSMSLRVSGILGGDAVACDSLVQSTCTLEKGSAFTLSVVPDDPPTAGYGGWQTLLDYGDLLYLPQNTATENKWDLSILPVRFPSSPTGKEGLVAHGDVSAFMFPLPLSTQSTAFVNLEMACLTNGQQAGTLTESVGLIDFDENLKGAVYAGSDVRTAFVPNVGELEINCVEVPPSVGGVAFDPDTNALALETPASSGGGIGVVTATVAGATAAVALAGVAWAAQRRRAR